VNNLIFDFTRVYPASMEEDLAGLRRLDFTDISECNMYCAEAAWNELHRRIAPYGASGIHFLDSGNYHYMTRLLLELIAEPVTLVVWDNHTDMQLPQMSCYASCGGWLRDVLEQNEKVKRVVLIGPDEEYLALDGAATYPQLTAFSAKRLAQGLETAELLAAVGDDYPLYLSIDKDILCTQDAKTNWNQGEMRAETLLAQLDALLAHHRILGADICGEYTQTTPFGEYLEAQRINGALNQKIFKKFLQS